MFQELSLDPGTKFAAMEPENLSKPSPSFFCLALIVFKRVS